VKFNLVDIIIIKRLSSFDMNFLIWYFRQAMGIMLVYDITNVKSFNNVTNWLRNIEEHASEDVVRILIGNKVMN